jgi:hypothetical protein
MHAGARGSAVRTARWLDIAETVMAEPLDPRGGTCSRAASFAATATLQQGACFNAAPLSSPPFAQHACTGAETQQSAARAGSPVDATKALTAMAAATQRMCGILLGSRLCDNSKSTPRPERRNDVHRAGVYEGAGVCIDWAA